VENRSRETVTDEANPDHHSRLRGTTALAMLAI